MARLSGNDIAHYQGDVDYNTYKNNAHFVIIKATEGIGYTDPKFIRNRDESRRVDMGRGFYHFARPDKNNTPENEAQYFLSAVGALQDGEVLALDYEVQNRTQDHVEWCRKWLEYIFQKTGVKALIYMSESVVNQLNWQSVVDGGYGLWIAKYLNNPNPDYTAYNTGKWAFAAMYQWTNRQVVPGVGPITDGDVFYGDLNTFKKYGYKKAVPPTPPTNYEELYKKEVEINKDLEGKLNAANSQIASLQSKIDNARNALS
jgi:lysozyme